MSAFIAPRLVYRTAASRAARRERAELAGSFPARKEVLMKLHELDRRCHGLFLAVHLENRVTANDLLGFDERAIQNAEPTIHNFHLRALSHRHQSAIVEHASGLDLAI